MHDKIKWRIAPGFIENLIEGGAGDLHLVALPDNLDAIEVRCDELYITNGDPVTIIARSNGVDVLQLTSAVKCLRKDDRIAISGLDLRHRFTF